MKYEYIMNKNYQYNGFYIDIDKNDVIDIKSFEPFGDCIDIETLQQLSNYILEYFLSIDDEYKPMFRELLYFIDLNIGGNDES